MHVRGLRGNRNEVTGVCVAEGRGCHLCAWVKDIFRFLRRSREAFSKTLAKRLFWRNLANACTATLPENTCNEPFLATNAHALAIFLSEAAADAAALFHTDACFLFTRRLQIPRALPFGAAAPEPEKVSD